jgi:hypothetical protein
VDPQLGVNIEELMLLLHQKGIPLPWEMGTFIALSACEAIVSAPALLSRADVWVDEQGRVAITTSARGVEETAAAQALVKVLGELLVGSAPGVPPMLLELVEQGPTDAQWTLRRLRDDLEAMLVPLNRGATTRVLARLIREAGRRGERGSMRPPAQAEIQGMAEQLDDLLGLQAGEAPHPPLPPEVRPERPSARPVDELGLHETASEPGQRAPVRAAEDDLIGRGEASSRPDRGWLALTLAVGIAVALAVWFAARSAGHTP